MKTITVHITDLGPDPRSIKPEVVHIQHLGDYVPSAGQGDVTMKELAAEVGMDRSACRKYVLRLGYKPVKKRTSESGFQTALTLTRQQADEIKAKRKAEGYL